MGKRVLLVSASFMVFLSGIGCSFGSVATNYGEAVGIFVDTASFINIIAGFFGLAPIIPNT